MREEMTLEEQKQILIDSYINKGEFDYDDIMVCFYHWLNDAKYTATNEVFDAGRTCIQAIINYTSFLFPIKAYFMLMVRLVSFKKKMKN